MKLMVLGGTGKTGVLFVGQALNAGHEVTAFVRRADSGVDARATKVVGEVTDPASLAEAGAGHDAVVSMLGSTGFGASSLIADSTNALIAAAHKNLVDRVLIMSAFGVGDSLNIASPVGKLMYRTVVRAPYRDKANAEAALRASDLDWTLAYPGTLKNTPHSAYDTLPLDELTTLPGVPTTARANAADFLLTAAVEHGYSRRTVVLRDQK